MKKMINDTHIEGYLFGHKLEAKVTRDNSKVPGTPYIRGTLSIATDEKAMNVVDITFPYVTATYASGAANATYALLSNIINGDLKMFPEVGTEAAKLRVDSAVGLNEYFDDQDVLHSYAINNGGFVHLTDTLNADVSKRSSFMADLLIESVLPVEGDPDKDTSDHVLVKGNVFDFRNSILPVSFVVKNSDGMRFFEGLGATVSEPVLMKVWGHIVSSTIETATIEASAFGEDAVKVTTRRLREWVISGCQPEPYVFDDEATITKAEVKAAMANRERVLAENKARSDEFKANKKAAATPDGFGKSAPSAAPAKSDFKF